MITDIFSRRYEYKTLWTGVQDREERFLVQAWRILEEQFFPIYRDGKLDAASEASWSSIHRTLSMELGVKELHPRIEGYYTRWNGNNHWNSITHPWGTICEKFMLRDSTKSASADAHMKDRISLLELAFRQRAAEIEQRNRELPGELARIQNIGRVEKSTSSNASNLVETMTQANASLNASLSNAAHELNERFRLARIGLNYHNGFIQRSTDHQLEAQVEQPFWALVAQADWKNVDLDMKEAIDRRDNSDRDPAFYAARALESAIKIISAKKGWTHGGEKGAHNYIDNLSAAKNGSMIAGWEASALKAFFTEVRNPFGHGPGAGTMPSLTPAQTDGAIDFCMSWIRNLIRRL